MAVDAQMWQPKRLTRHDAKPTERSYGKCGSAFLGIALLGFAIRVDTLVNMKEGANQRDQDKGLDSPSPCPLGFLPLGSLFPYPYPHPVGVLAKLE